MDYKGKLYGKVAGKYIELAETTDSLEADRAAIRKAAMEERETLIKQMGEALEKTRQALACPMGDRANFLAIEANIEADKALAAYRKATK